MAKFLLRCAEDVDIFHAAAVIAGSVMRIALEMLLMIRAFDKLMLRGILTCVSSQNCDELHFFAFFTFFTFFAVA